MVALLVIAAAAAGYLVGREQEPGSGEHPAETRIARPAPRPAAPAAPAEPPRKEPAASAPQPAEPPAEPRQTAKTPPAAEPVPEASGKPAPAKPGATLAWQKNAVPVRDPGGRPMIAIVLDDVGVNRAQARKAIELRGPLTLSFMTYAEDLPKLTAAARAAGHELMLHMPMEPSEKRVPPGPEALMVGLDTAELNRRILWGLNRFEGFVGVNNHMGSRFTRDERGMAAVMGQLKAHGLLFLDSLTTPDSVGIAAAARFGVPHVGRDVFLDHVQDRDAIRASLARLEARARSKGHAVGIGHPHEETLDVLRGWLGSLEARGFALVPVSTIVRRLRDMPAEPGRQAAAGQKPAILR